MKYIRDPGSNPNSFHLPNSFFPCLTHNVRLSQIFRDLDLVFRDKKNKWNNEAVFSKIVEEKI